MAHSSESRPPLTTRPNGAWARYLTSALGAWLFYSAFLWPHSDAQHVNTCVVGALLFFVALLASIAPLLRFLNTAIASWLFLSTLVIGASAPTLLNNLTVAVAVFLLSLIPMAKQARVDGPTEAPSR